MPKSLVSRYLTNNGESVIEFHKSEDSKSLVIKRFLYGQLDSVVSKSIEAADNVIMKLVQMGWAKEN